MEETAMHNDNLNPTYSGGGMMTSGVAGFVVGTAVGAGLALLLAPATGADTRRKIGETARNFSEGARHKLGQMRDNWSQRREHAVSRTGTEAFQSSHEPGTYR
jgi:gas vesicle protein